MSRTKDRVSTAVSLPIGLANEIDQLIEEKVFSSRSEALRYGARLAVLFYNRVHFRAEEYGYEETKRRLRRGKRVS
ncbi:MAG: CopG family transcriptional regulator [Thermoplasmata archaeon]|nr:MAG: CopG family transcriptional regulator [Thermoplasmata archaeon]